MYQLSGLIPAFKTLHFMIVSWYPYEKLKISTTGKRLFPVGHGQSHVSSVYIQGHTTAKNKTNDPSLSVIFAFLSMMSPGQHLLPYLMKKDY